MRGSLVVVLPVADDGGQAFAHQRFGNVAAGEKSRGGGSAPAEGAGGAHLPQQPPQPDPARHTGHCQRVEEETHSPSCHGQGKVLGATSPLKQLPN